jgi:hypothetical protein
MISRVNFLQKNLYIVLSFFHVTFYIKMIVMKTKLPAFFRTIPLVLIPLDELRIIPPGELRIIPPGELRIIPPGELRIIPPGELE